MKVTILEITLHSKRREKRGYCPTCRSTDLRQCFHTNFLLRKGRDPSSLPQSGSSIAV